MTEVEWLACEEPKPMLLFIDDAMSYRRLQLFACACCRAIMELLPDDVSVEAIAAAERSADQEPLTRSLFDSMNGIAREIEALAERYDQQGLATHDHQDKSLAHQRSDAAAALAAAVNPSDTHKTLVVHYSAACAPDRAAAFRHQAGLLRDIFGNPCRPVAFSPNWRTDTALSLARQMYDSHDFSTMPILADVLQDAGCDNEDILNHCRGPGPHVRGCWVVDLVLAKRVNPDDCTESVVHTCDEGQPMTETEWLRAKDPTPMLEFLRGKVSDRKVALFAVACSYRVRKISPGTPFHTALEVAERYLDGNATEMELGTAQKAAHNYRSLPDGIAELAAYQAIRACERAIDGHSPPDIFFLASDSAGAAVRAKWRLWRSQERLAQTRLLREIVGNPFQSPHVAPSWLTSNVLALASGIYSEKAFDRLPILAYALQDAGCDNEEILNHCRDAKQTHVRGCWVVDLVLEKA